MRWLRATMAPSLAVRSAAIFLVVLFLVCRLFRGRGKRSGPTNPDLSGPSDVRDVRAVSAACSLSLALSLSLILTDQHATDRSWIPRFSRAATSEAASAAAAAVSISGKRDRHPSSSSVVQICNVKIQRSLSTRGELTSSVCRDSFASTKSPLPIYTSTIAKVDRGEIRVSIVAFDQVGYSAEVAV